MDDQPPLPLAERVASSSRSSLEREKERGQRSRDGCLTCRARKVKCNEQRPLCDKCRIKSRECIWPSGDESERRKNKKRRLTQQQTASPSSSSATHHLPLINHHSASSSTSNIEQVLSPTHVPSVESRSRSTHSTRSPKEKDQQRRTTNVRGQVVVPPGFLPPDALENKGKTREKELDVVGWLVPEAMRAQLMMEPSFLQPYFPTLDERLVIRHYLSRTVHIIIAFESKYHPWNPWISIHAPLAFKHLPGTNPAADALRTAMLAVGSVHLQYANNPEDQGAAWRVTKGAKVTVLRLIKETLEDKNGKARVLSQEDIELVLAALLSCTIASSLAADDSWHHLLASVLAFIDQLGGAQHILRDAPRDKLSPCRFFMEQLAIRDVFGCMTTELAPTILQDAFTPWFFESESWSRIDLEWESVERMFGISRGMVDMIARACTLIAAVRSRGKPLPEPSKSDDPDTSSDRALTTLKAAAQGLTAELQVWDEAENFTPLHPRTQYGNHSYRHAIKIRLLKKVYNVPSDDERVVKSSMAIIELAGEMLALYGKITWLTWPILIAGFEIPPNHPARRTALEMLGAFGPHACFDNRAGARMLSDYWMWHDMDGDHATSWEVAQILNQRPFLD
ncbi:hypothetical protein CI109_104657 [Kwoniella shandongensis]|uniref:Uncharacterized protein n=1 Tax=Kwoniella shandongensis TaxID=1734106 RepID=A0A5M6BVV5_9TREE|nr:uncharacterized protein CI109_004823 [Kwoniella shandongensis]KAA5526823.1 hypothetical protein CI109_004823 [Kwoniella shandongensis]